MSMTGKDAFGFQDAVAADAGTISGDAVRAELTRLLADSDFGASERRRKLLDFLVTETLAGRGDQMKGTVLAQEVFARGAGFDPQTDPVVRIEARRLRRDLDCYYANFGARATVRFAIPKGAYIASFTQVSNAELTPGEVEGTWPEPDDIAPPPDPVAANLRKWRVRPTHHALVWLLLCITVLGAVIWLTAKRPVAGLSSEPGLAIAPFEAIGGTTDSAFLARGLSEQLINDLMPFDGFRVYALPEDRTSLTEDNLRALKTDYGIEYLVTGTLRSGAEDGRVRLIAQMRRSDGQIVWSGDFDRHQTARDLMSLQDAMSNAVATTLGQTYGIVAKDIGVGSAQRTIPGDDTFSCLLRAHAYRRSFTSELRGQTADCVSDT